MLTTGIVRRIDDLGRIIIPKEVRRTLAIGEGDPMEVYIDKANQSVVFKKFEVHCSCIFCGKQDNLTETFMDKEICQECLDKLSKKSEEEEDNE